MNGYLRSDGMLCNIINVHALCELQDKRVLWDAIKIIVEQNAGVCVCV